MLYGWRIFRYTRDIKTEVDYRSACNTALFPYGETLFKNEQRDSLRIYTNTSKQLEVFLSDGRIELRLHVWMPGSTLMILLEKSTIEDMGWECIERELTVRVGDRRFSIAFYKKQEMDECVRMLKDCRSEWKAMDECHAADKAEDKSSVAGTSTSAMKALIKSLYELSGGAGDIPMLVSKTPTVVLNMKMLAEELSKL